MLQYYNKVRYSVKVYSKISKMKGIMPRIVSTLDLLFTFDTTPFFMSNIFVQCLVHEVLVNLLNLHFSDVCFG